MKEILTQKNINIKESSYEEILKVYKPVIKYIVSRYTGSELGKRRKDDYYQEVIITLIDAIKRYDPTKSKVPFGQFFYIMGTQRLTRLVKEFEYYANSGEKTNLTFNSDYYDFNPDFNSKTPEEILIINEEKANFNNFINSLNEMEQEIFKLKFEEDMPDIFIYEKLDMSYPKFADILQGIIKKYKKILK